MTRAWVGAPQAGAALPAPVALSPAAPPAHAPAATGSHAATRPRGHRRLRLDRGLPEVVESASEQAGLLHGELLLDAGVLLHRVQDAAGHVDPRTTSATTGPGTTSGTTPPTPWPARCRCRARPGTSRRARAVLSRPRSDRDGSRPRWHYGAVCVPSLRGSGPRGGVSLGLWPEAWQRCC